MDFDLGLDDTPEPAPVLTRASTPSAAVNLDYSSLKREKKHLKRAIDEQDKIPEYTAELYEYIKSQQEPLFAPADSQLRTVFVDFPTGTKPIERAWELSKPNVIGGIFNKSMRYFKKLSDMGAEASRAIDKDLSADHHEQSMIMKIALCGGPAGGKTTYLKQIRILANADVKDAATQQYRKRQIILDCMRSMKFLLNLAKRELDVAELTFDSAKAQEHAQYMSEIPVSVDAWNKEVGLAIRTLWADPNVKKYYDICYHKSSKLNSAAYLFDQIDRIMDDAYIPTYEDDLRVQESEHVNALDERIHLQAPMMFTEIDLGCAKPFRAGIEALTAILFFVDMTGYARASENGYKTEMDEALSEFETLSSLLHVFRGGSLVVFFSHRDKFLQTLPKIPLQSWRQEFQPSESTNDDNYVNEAMKFIRDEFMSRSSHRETYFHFITTIDTECIRFIWKAVFDTSTRHKVFADAVKQEIVGYAKQSLISEQYTSTQNKRSGDISSAVSTLFKQIETLDAGFVNEIAQSCASHPQELSLVFVPCFQALAAALRAHHAAGSITNQPRHSEFLSHLFKLTATPAGLVAFTALLKDEIARLSNSAASQWEANTVLGAFMAVSPLGPAQAPKYFGTIPSYPDGNYADVVQVQQAIWNQMMPYQEQLHNFVKAVMNCKENNQEGKEILLNWFAEFFRLNRRRTSRNPADLMQLELSSIVSSDGCTSNAAKIFLLLSGPFLDTSTGRHKMIHPRFAQFTQRIDLEADPKLIQSSAFDIEGLDEKVQAGQFPFISDIFWLTQMSLFVGLVPCYDTYESAQSQLHRMKQSLNALKSQFGADSPALQSNPQYFNLSRSVAAVHMALDAFDSLIANENTLMLALKFVHVTAFWMLDLIKSEQKRPEMLEQLFASYPEWLVKSSVKILLFVSHYRPKYLTSPTLPSTFLPTIFEWLVTLLNQPSQFLKSPIVRSKISTLLHRMHEMGKVRNNPQQGFGFGAFNFGAPASAASTNPHVLDMMDNMLFSRLFDNAASLNITVVQTGKESSASPSAVTAAKSSAAISQLVFGLFQIYSDIDIVEGLDVDKENFDKFHIRHDISILLTTLWSSGAQAYKDLIKGAIVSGSPISAKFMATLLSDASFLLDDSLGRLMDIRQLQLAMEDTVEWNKQDEIIKQEREAYFRGQENAARGFLGSALASLELLNLTCQDAAIALSYARSSDTRKRLGAMLLHFFEILCGPKMSNLKVKNPEKYNFSPKDLLRRIAKIALALSDEVDVQKELAADIDYNPGIMEKACQILSRDESIVSRAESDKFSKFCSSVAQFKAEATAALEALAAKTVAIQEDAMDVDEQNEIQDALEQEYVWRMKELGLFGEANMKNDADEYRHHYAKNIVESANSFNKEKMQRLAQESAMLMESLPVSRASSVFVRTDEERIDVMKALITGPQGTPYSQGCFVFDIFFPGTYPNDPPLVNLETTGSGTVRFNPNLYNDGKVCLSLLGTWHGDKDSKWNSSKSNLHQVLVSIQALILVEQPYFNEPSYEAQRGTAEGTSRAAEYNEGLRYNNIRYAMLEQLRNPPPEFEEVIKSHFLLQQNAILAECEQWLKEASVTGKPKLERLILELKAEFAKLS